MEHFQALLRFRPTEEILLSMVEYPADLLVMKTSFQVLMDLTTWHLNLGELATVARELDTDATANPSKMVIQRLSKGRSLVLQVLSDVIRLREVTKNYPSDNYKLLSQVMVIVKLEYPEIDWIQEEQYSLSADVSIILRVLSRLEQQAEELSSQLCETFQTLTTAIAIEDSEFNKKQAQRSTQLTLLAAIYLPLTLATGIFGMNIQEINGGTPHWWVVFIVIAILFLPSASFVVMLFAGDDIKKTVQAMRDRKEREIK
ncbi:uncharacterized protein CC84DRAFT_908274 [Paraphaeosphaeria sporulosa]|uniref:Mg2+ transporter protein n=1 Tax=Paraphaeosphaeria sporulosa TaxID=1460663 RepID=A0A177C795_9PLEO|nr:uncharacterized protein CC84DRAFT_908274 [Paraphaeosphaeria sporulosa]OAG02648.1 hypothetical protein CC84DRAFT_908274 [Paraphaeosphaeria sporulosa]